MSCHGKASRPARGRIEPIENHAVQHVGKRVGVEQMLRRAVRPGRGPDAEAGLADERAMEQPQNYNERRDQDRQGDERAA